MGLLDQPDLGGLLGAFQRWRDQGGLAGSMGMQPADAQMMQAAQQQAPLIQSGQYGQAALAGLGNPILGAIGTGALGIKAYHGSPYDFNSFDASKIGTGEGAQAYGHGFYFADNPAVAEQYKMSGNSRFNRLTTGAMTPQQEFAHDLASNGHNESGILDALAQKYGSNISFDDAYKLAKDAVNARGKMYEVNINADPEQFLNWDKPLSQQPQGVQAALKNLSDVYPTSQYKLQGRLLPGQSATGSHMYQALAQFMGGSRPMAGGMYDVPYTNDAAASQLLQSEAGVPGIRYLDQGSRGAGQGTSNYVVFDPAIVDILRKYGLTGGLATAGAMLGANQQQ